MLTIGVIGLNGSPRFAGKMSAMSRFARQACGYPLAHGARARTVQRRGSRRRQDRFHCGDLAIAFLAVRPSKTAIVRSRVFSAATGAAPSVFWHHLGACDKSPRARCGSMARNFISPRFRDRIATIRFMRVGTYSRNWSRSNFKSSELNSDRR
jgi:hypothetical protein